MNDFLAIGYNIDDIEAFFGESFSKLKKTEYINFVEYYIKDNNKKSELYLYTEVKKSFLWKKTENFLCAKPSFCGITKQSVKKLDFVFSNECPLCVSLNLWVGKNGEDYPLRVDVPNYLEIKDIDLSIINNISITLFPHQLSYWPDVQSFEKEAEKTKMAVKSLIPSGTFSVKENDKDFKPSASCICNGIVISAEEITNEHTGLSLYHLVINTYGADYDVVVQKDALKELPKINSVVGGTFWVCGKLIKN